MASALFVNGKGWDVPRWTAPSSWPAPALVKPPRPREPTIEELRDRAHVAQVLELGGFHRPVRLAGGQLIHVNRKGQVFGLPVGAE